MIAPPSTPQLEKDKQSIDESFQKAFNLLDQLSRDTEALKVTEHTRSERLDAALMDVDSVVGELKDAIRRREDDNRRISDEVRGLQNLIPKAIEGQREATDARLRDLNSEMSSLKALMAQRLNPLGAKVANPQEAVGMMDGISSTSHNSVHHDAPSQYTVLN